MGLNLKWKSLFADGKIRIFKDYETDPWFEQNYVGNDLNYVSLGAPSGSSIIHYNCSA